ncbi:MAG: response regulator transcription factor [Marinilabiliaceae bacterium]|nr:response regulator transcription factor [Marinilabiliaceae bacterium]
MTLTCIAIDDEPLALAKLKAIIAQIPYVELKETFSNCIDAIPYLTAQSPDILFLDIQMDHMTGIQLLEKVKVKPHVIIISAFEQYALKGYELNLTDYILKPYGIHRLIQAIEKIKQIKEATDLESKAVKDYIFIKTDYRILKMNLQDILYIEGMRDYLCLHTKSEKILTHITFRELHEMLPADQFIRVHKSYMVHLAFIETIEKHRIYIQNAIIPISHTYREAFYKAIKA